MQQTSVMIFIIIMRNRPTLMLIYYHFNKLFSMHFQAICMHIHIHTYIPPHVAATSVCHGGNNFCCVVNSKINTTTQPQQQQLYKFSIITIGCLLAIVVWGSKMFISHDIKCKSVLLRFVSILGTWCLFLLFFYRIFCCLFLHFGEFVVYRFFFKWNAALLRFWRTESYDLSWTEKESESKYSGGIGAI